MNKKSRPEKFLRRKIGGVLRTLKSINRERGLPLAPAMDPRKQIFALDGHTSVMPDLREVVKKLSDIEIEHWSIVDKPNPSIPTDISDFKIMGLKPLIWDRAVQRNFNKFEKAYKFDLERKSGFIAAHPSSFATIYKNFAKPVLFNISTRYEHPFSHSKQDWQNLNRTLHTMHESNLLFPVANNIGDKEYFEFFTGIECLYAPSACSYVGDADFKEKHGNVIIAQDPKLSELIKLKTKGLWKPLRDVVGKHYSWADLSRLESVVLIPYNSSTMTLFELAALNVRVFIPDLNLMSDLKNKHDGVMDQLSFLEISGARVPNFLKNSPADYLADDHLKWWFDRADFNENPFMQNVTLFSDFEELEALLKHAPFVDSQERYEKNRLAISDLRVATYTPWHNAVIETLN